MNNVWNYHDKQLKKLKQIYNRTSKQKQNNLQEIFDSYKIDFEHLYSITDNKTLNRIKTKIEEWKDKGLLNGYFGMLANNIYKKTRVKNSEILELLIYGAYVEEQSKLEETELNTFKDVANYYYQEGQKQVNGKLKKKKPISTLDMALFLALMEQPVYNGYTFKQNIEIMTRYNVEQIYKQCLINIMQRKENNIDDPIIQNIIKRQQNTKLCINGDKISGSIDLTMIGINNKCIVEGIKSIDKNAKVQFISDKCDNVTPMCMNMDRMIFNVNDYNEFIRYVGTSTKDVRQEKIKVFGLVQGVNLPPINNFFHWCHSYLIYVKNKGNEIPEMKPLIKQGLKVYSRKELKQLSKITSDIANKYTNNKSKWSGKIIVDNKNAPGKLWNCNIRVSNEIAPHILLHEQLHAHSISYFDKETYDKYGEIEEATVQLYAQEISRKEGIHIIPSEYDENINILKEINNKVHIGKDDFEFAKTLFEKPVNERIDFIEDKIYDIMQTGNIKEYMELNSLLDTFRR